MRGEGGRGEGVCGGGGDREEGRVEREARECKLGKEGG